MQLRLLMEAEEIVAIHGAAVAPLIYRSVQAPRAKLVEIFPCTKMTNVWRAMGHLVGCDWSGVRGKIEPAHLKGLYDISMPYLSDGDADFEADPVSLERALAVIGAGG
jgi:hypothetical protein